MRIQYVRYFFALCALTIGCDDSSSGGESGTTEDMETMTPDGDMGMNNMPPPLGARELQIQGERSVLAFYGGTSELSVAYVDANGGIANARVTATLVDPGGNEVASIEGTQLNSANATTNAQGIATFTLTAGMRSANFKVKASAQDAQPVQWDVSVAREGAGGINVRMTYDTNAGRYDFTQIAAGRVDLFNGQNCDLLRASATMLAGAFIGAEVSPLNEVDNSVGIGDLDDGASFSVAATGRNANGNVLTFGCLDGVTIAGGMVQELEVPMTDLPLSFKGNYNVVHRFDLTDLLANSENTTLATVAQVMEVLRILGTGGERGQALTDLLCDYVDIGEGTCDLVRSIGGRLVDEAFERVIPPNVLTLLEAISDVMSIFTDLTVVGVIQLDDQMADGTIVGNDNRWQKFQFTWRTGCPEGEDCTREFALGDLSVDDRPIFGTFNANQDGSTLNIEAHSITFRYGLIALGIINSWVVPRLLDPPSDMPVSLEEGLTQIVPCGPVNEFLTGDAGDGICERIIVAALAEVITSQLGMLEFEPGQFQISGTVTPVDNDGDLAIDALEGGVWTGEVTIGDAPIPFAGCFTGCRPGAGEDCSPEVC